MGHAHRLHAAGHEEDQRNTISRRTGAASLGIEIGVKVTMMRIQDENRDEQLVRRGDRSLYGNERKRRVKRIIVSRCGWVKW